MRTRIALACLALAASGAPSRAPIATSRAVPASRLPLGLHWQRNSAEFRAVAYQNYVAAGRRLRELVASQRGPWAVALDGDETVMDNTDYQNNPVYGPWTTNEMR